MSSITTKVKESKMSVDEFYAERSKGNVLWLLLVLGSTLFIMGAVFVSRMM